jgi:hypothetical protein
VVSLVGCPVANGLSCLSKDQPTVSTVSSRAGLARAAGRSRRGPPLRHADQLAPTHGRRCSDAGDASRRFLASLPRSASASDVRWASCRTALRGMAQRRSRHDRPAALASTARAACRAFGAKRVRSAPHRVPRNRAEAALEQAVRITPVVQTDGAAFALSRIRGENLASARRKNHAAAMAVARARDG